VELEKKRETWEAGALGKKKLQDMERVKALFQENLTRWTGGGLKGLGGDLKNGRRGVNRGENRGK